MAIVYGVNISKKNIFNLAPDFLKNDFENILFDIENLITKYNEDVKLDKEYFLNNHNNILEEYKHKLKKYYNDHELKIKEINDSINTASFFLKFYLKHIKLPIYVKRHKKKIELEENKIKNIEENPECLFTNYESTTYFKLKKLKEIKNNPEYPKAILEQKILNELIKLNNDFHILCSINIDLKKIKIKQLKKKPKFLYFDYILVSKKGMFLININYEKLNLDKTLKQNFDKKTYLENLILFKNAFELYLKQNLILKDVAITESRIFGFYINDFEFNLLDTEIKEIDINKLINEIAKNEDNLYSTETAKIVNFLNNYTNQI